MVVRAPKKACRRRKGTTTVGRERGKNTTTFSEQTGSLFFSLLNKDCRLKIYEAMLALNESYKCSAQVLTICKKLNEEAADFLYNDNNTFHVGVGESDVFVNGGKIGSADYASAESAKRLAWPNYLLKCRRLRVERVPYEEGVSTDGYRDGTDVLDPTEAHLHLLCKFLGQRHSLKLLTIDMRIGTRTTAVDLYPTHLVSTPLLKIVAEGVIDPISWRSSPTALPRVADMTPAMAAGRVIPAMDSLLCPLAEMWCDPFKIPSDPWNALFFTVFDKYPLFEQDFDFGPYGLPGWAMLDMMHDMFATALDLNLIEDQVGEPADDPREQVFAVRHAYIDLQVACQKTGDDADKLLADRFQVEGVRESGPYDTMWDFEGGERWENCT